MNVLQIPQDILDSSRLTVSELKVELAVWDELNAGRKRWPGSDEVATANWIEQHPVQNHLEALRQTAGFYLSQSLYQYALELAGENGG